MRISNVRAQSVYSVQRNSALKSANSASNVYSISSLSAGIPPAVISFGGIKNKNQTVHYLAEFPPYASKGGVGTVGDDYKNMAKWNAALTHSPEGGFENFRFLPYYNAKVEYDPQTGEATGKIAVRRLEDGTPIYISHKDLMAKGIDGDEAKAIAKGKYTVLEQIGETKQMQWGLDEIPIALYRVKNDPTSFMIYSDGTARMPEPYAGGSCYSSNAEIPRPTGFDGNPYAQNGKAFTELLPNAKQLGINAETIICSDAQASFIPEYMAQQVKAGNTYYQGVKLSDVFHNMGLGYTGDISAQEMFANFATKEQIEAVLQDPKYFEALKYGKTEEYFQSFIKPAVVTSVLDKNQKSVSPNMIPLYYIENGRFVTTARTVSEGYAESVAKNPNVSPFLQPTWARLYEEGKVGGILNGLDKENLMADKPLPLKCFNQDFRLNNKGEFEVISEGEDTSKAVFKRFAIFEKDATYESMRKTKALNKRNLLSRFDGTVTDSRIIAGAEGKEIKLLGSIDKKYVQMLDNGKNVNLFVSWGRGDMQKGYPIVIKAFEKFAKTPEGKDTVIIMGGELAKDNPESAIIKKLMERVNKDPELKGRMVFVDGFAPGAAFSSAADAAVLTSKFAPCELTDLEASRHYATPIVTNTQGMAQKNFDPRNSVEAPNANAYKTVHEFYMPDNQLDSIVKAFGTDNATLQEQVKQEFNLVSDSVFTDFTEQYKKIYNQIKNDYINRGVIADKLDECVASAVKKSPEYNELIIQLKENILADETVDAMARKIKGIGTDVDIKIFENQKSMNTTWLGNAQLHPGDNPISSAAMYKQFMVDPKPGKVISTVYNFDNDVFERAKSALSAESVKENAGFMNKLKSGLKDKRVLAALAGVAAVGAIAAGVVHSNKKNKEITGAKQAETPAPVEQTPPPPPAPPAMAQPAAAPNAFQASPATATQTQQPSSINLANNKFAACFNKIA